MKAWNEPIVFVDGEELPPVMCEKPSGPEIEWYRGTANHCREHDALCGDHESVCDVVHSLRGRGAILEERVRQLEIRNG